MIRKERLVQIYISQYQENAKNQKKKKRREGKSAYLRKIDSLYSQMKRINSPRQLTQAQLEEFHRRLRSISQYVFRQSDKLLTMQVTTQLFPELVRLDVLSLKPGEQELITSRFVDYLRGSASQEICGQTLGSLCRRYADHGITRQVIDLVPAKPEMEFPKALEMKRNFILHIGPTNCGKTYHALERLKEAKNGVYLGPLRLLALEVYERMKEEKIPCTMLTGEECILEEDSRITASTIEMLDMEQSYDVAVIDEAQMIADSDRGHSWTRAILGVRAGEIHVCMSPAAEEVVKHLIALGGGSCEVRRYERKTGLLCEKTPFSFPEDVQEGDALIVFTKRAVMDLAGRLEREGIRASVVYGSLPPEIRRRQIHLFTEKETRVVVSTDAIGMGLNLPVRRIVFVHTEKFDGKSKRLLQAAEIKQIAGRAGRFGLYDTGYVNAMGEEALTYIREHIGEEEQPIRRVSLGFPGVLLDMDEPLDMILQIWKSVEPDPPFEKISIDEILFLYEKAYRARKEIDGFKDKHILYRMLTCSIDVRSPDIVDAWLNYCRTYTADVSLTFPAMDWCHDTGLAKYETYYKLLDLYHQFSARMGKNIDVEQLDWERERTEDTIMRYLVRDKRDYIQKCKYCGKTLPLGMQGRVCDQCFEGTRPWLARRKAVSATAESPAAEAVKKKQRRRRRRKSNL